jgi:S1-C subfamily serine protease
MFAGAGVALGAGLVAALAGVAGYRLLEREPVPVADPDVEAAVQQAIASTTPPPAFSADVYQTISPSLVLIRIELAADPGQTDGDEAQLGIGSGVIVSDDGAILTANHVVADAATIEVVFADGTQSAARILSAEPENDIAVLQADQGPEVIVPAVIGSSDRLRIGDEAYAVGNPLGLTGSMSAGVISGFDRSAPIVDSDQSLDGLIQFDTAVNPGSSGGPLLNRQGQVVGIVTALANPGGQDYFVGIGFAVPIGVASSAAGGPPQ